MQDASPTETPTPPVDAALDAPFAARTAVRGSILRSGAYAAGVALSLISAPLLIRQLGVADFGVYVTITALVTIVAGMSDFGLTSLGVREWSQRDHLARNALMRDLLGARLAFTAVGVAAALLFAVLAGYDSRRMAGTALACLAIVLMGMQSALTVPLAGRLRQGLIGAADLVRQVVQVALVIALVLAGAGLVLLLAVAIPAALASLVFTARSAPDGLVLPAIDPRHWAALLRGTIPFAAASAVSVLYLRTTVILSSVVGTADQVGQFAIAFRVLEVLIGIPTLLVGALFPLFARAAVTDSGRLRTAVERTWQGSFAVGGVAAVSVAAGAPIAVLLLSGREPDAAIDALRILAFGLGCSFIGATCQYSLLAVRAHRPILIINLAALTTNAALTLALAPAHGARGAAIALAVSELIIAIASTLLLRRALQGLQLGFAVPARVAVSVGVGVLATVALTPIGALAAAVAAPLLALTATVALRALPPELISALPLPRGTT